MYRMTQHPIIDITEGQAVTFYYNGKPLQAQTGDTIAAALTANGIRVFRRTSKHHETRGLFCGIGQCTDCVMVVDGQPNVRTCVTIVKDGMHVQTQDGLKGHTNEAI